MEDLRAIRATQMDGLAIGRIVHYVRANGVVVAAMIVKVWSSDGMINLTTFPDWSNDGAPTGMEWETSRHYSDRVDGVYPPATWHWPERV